jgi:hypothetical protein
LDVHQERDSSTLLPSEQVKKVPFAASFPLSLWFLSPLRFRQEKAEVKNFSLSSDRDHD